ncbi:hypothetical protein AGOR_G00034610 [Albula goreensis]|uniref:Uncharacterized protein n=1 Tax=Albula goreensis TaxID=1534307 RepID=A0A8T3E492_9TELE|nr:hypothetical protein AGOR_G00034610 [Albula goreensis]
MTTRYIPTRHTHSLLKDPQDVLTHSDENYTSTSTEQRTRTLADGSKQDGGRWRLLFLCHFLSCPNTVEAKTIAPQQYMRYNIQHGPPLPKTDKTQRSHTLLQTSHS